MKQTTPVTFVICALSSAAILLSGCQSGFLNKPEFGKLAFWKNDTLRLASNDVPPPSRQFSPDRGEEGSGTKAEMKANIDQIIASAKRSDAPEAVEASDPIRKPYSLDSISPKLAEQKPAAKPSTKTGSNDFVLSNKMNQFQAKTTEVLNKTENAIANTKQAIQNTENSFAGWKNTLKNNTENKIENAASQLKTTVDGAVANTANTINGVAKSTTDSVNQTVSNITTSVDNSFKPGGKVIKNPYSNQGNSTTQSSTASASDFLSKYKLESQSANQVVSEPAPALAKNKLLQPAFKQPSSDIKQSSFNSAIQKTNASLLQPAESPQKKPSTQYPSTSFGEFKPVQTEASKTKTPGTAFEIPKQLLQGTSSFSPGSTKPLRPNSSSN